MTDTRPTETVATSARRQPLVLFVDDEPEVLGALRSTLRPLRADHRLLFAAGAAEALAQLEQEPVDVVLTEGRMAGVDGFDLLDHVRRHHPATVRIMLSGATSERAVLDAMPLAHRWLSKPCPRGELIEAVHQAVRHRSFLADPAVAEALAGTSSLPTPPRLYGELQQLLASPDVAIEEVVRVVQADPAVAAKVLQWAGSAFAGNTRLPGLHAAVVQVGLSALSQMALMAGVIRSFDAANRLPGLTIDTLVKRVGNISAIAGAQAPDGQSDLARLGGLFTAIGLVLEADALPDRLEAAYDEATRLGRPLVEVERHRFGAAHPALGAHLLALWGMPTELVELVAAAHDHPEPRTEPARSALEAVQRARLVAQRRSGPTLGDPYQDQPDPELTAAVERWARDGDDQPDPCTGAHHA
ncbi:MAG: HDOD domain-containing protein [Actinomycetota bacterium]